MRAGYIKRTHQAIGPVALSASATTDVLQQPSSNIAVIYSQGRNPLGKRQIFKKTLKKTTCIISLNTEGPIGRRSYTDSDIDHVSLPSHPEESTGPSSSTGNLDKELKR
jgi:hypothetical protein